MYKKYEKMCITESQELWVKPNEGSQLEPLRDISEKQRPGE